MSLKLVKQRMERFLQCYSNSLNYMKREKASYYHVIHNRSAVDQSQDAILMSLSHIHDQEKFVMIENLDFWNSIYLYQQSLAKTYSDLNQYFRFVKAKEKCLLEMVQAINEFLKSTAKVFVHEEFKIWQETASSMLEPFGLDSNVMLVHSHGDEDEASPTKAGSAGNESTAPSDPIDHNTVDVILTATGSLSSADSPAPSRDSAVTPLRSSIRSSFRNSRIPLVAAPSTPDALIDDFNRACSIGTDISRLGVLSFRECLLNVAKIGWLKFCLTKQKSSQPVKDEKRVIRWQDTLVLLTYDRGLHFLRVKEEAIAAASAESDESVRFMNILSDPTKHDLFLSFNTRSATTSMLYLPEEEDQVVFELRLQGAIKSFLASSHRTNHHNNNDDDPEILGKQSGSFSSTTSASNSTQKPTSNNGNSSSSTNNNISNPIQHSPVSSKKLSEAVTGVMLRASSTQEAREWMRAINSPFSDFTVEVPFKVDEAALDPAAQSMQSIHLMTLLGLTDYETR